ncbi:MAG: hypothetical protein AAGA48_19005 [Myxococcota bacterium]
MKGDFSRNRGLRNDSTSGVRFLHGRSLLDSNLNEQLDIALADRRAGRSDIIGAFGIPLAADLGVQLQGTSLVVQGGTAYVAGRRVIVPPATIDITPQLRSRFAVRLAVDLVVRERSVTELDEPSLVEPALLGVDHSVRQRLVAEVRVRQATESVCQGVRRVQSPLRMRPLLEAGNAYAGPCQIPDAVGYRGLDHVHVRLEVHRIDDEGIWVKWDRDNGSVELEALGLVEAQGGQLLLVGPLDPARALEQLESGDLLEIEGFGLVQVAGTDAESRGLLVGRRGNEPFFSPTDFPGTALRLRRWQGLALVQLGQPFPLFEGLSAEITEGPLPPGTTAPSDYRGTAWSFVARAAVDGAGWGTIGQPLHESAEAPDHFVVGLAVFDAPALGGAPRDCRKRFPPLTLRPNNDGCATFVVEPETWLATLSGLQPGRDVHICFRRGVYETERPVELRGLGHLVLSGCGPATRIIGRGAETVLRLVDCDSVRVEALAIEALESASRPGVAGTLTLLRCGRMDVRRCRLTAASLVRRNGHGLLVDNRDLTRHPQRASLVVSNCDVAIPHAQTGIDVRNVAHVRIEHNTLLATGSATLEDGTRASGFASQGISVLGSGLLHVDVRSNRIEAVEQGIAIDPEFADDIGRTVVRVEDNAVSIVTTQFLDERTARPGIQIGSAERTVIRRNEVFPVTPSGWPESRGDFGFSEGILVEGRFGPVIRLCQNSVAGARFGVRASVVSQASPAQRMYRTTGNLLIDGERCYLHEEYDASLTLRDATFWVHQNAPAVTR